MSVTIPEYVMRNFFILLGSQRERLGVDWCINQDHGVPQQLLFTSFHRFGGNKGDGAKAMTEICELANAYGLNIRLWTDFKRLVPYYEQFGFECTETYSNHWIFIRKPKSFLNGKLPLVPSWHETFHKRAKNISIAQSLGF